MASNVHVESYISDSNSSDVDHHSDESDYDSPSPPQSGHNLPYRFEPLERERRHVSSESESEDENGIPMDIQRIGNAEWCKCSHCISMLTVEESVCCQEHDLIQAKAEPNKCIAQTEEFLQVCTLPAVLDTAYIGYRREGYPVQDNSHQKYRYTAYRQFIRWVFGYVGKKKRIPIPSCAVKAIRDKFPDPDYVGFKDTNQ